MSVGSPRPAWGVLPDDVLELYDRLARVGVNVWVDGGWGVDAMIGEQTRPHDDLDLIVARVSLPTARAELADFASDEAALPARLVMDDGHSLRVDLHIVVFDGFGDGWQDLPDGGRSHFPATELQSGGKVGGRPVRCVSPRLQIRHHAEYEPDAIDYHDVQLLVEAFGLEAPATHGAPPGWVRPRRERVIRALIGLDFAPRVVGPNRWLAPAELTERLAELRAGALDRRR